MASSLISRVGDLAVRPIGISGRELYRSKASSGFRTRRAPASRDRAGHASGLPCCMQLDTEHEALDGRQGLRLPYMLMQQQMQTALLGQSCYAATVRQLEAKLAEGKATKVIAAEPQAISNKARRVASRALQHRREERSLRRIAETQKDLFLRENEELKQKVAELEGDSRFLKTKFRTSEEEKEEVAYDNRRKQKAMWDMAEEITNLRGTVVKDQLLFEAILKLPFQLSPGQEDPTQFEAEQPSGLQEGDQYL